MVVLELGDWLQITYNENMKKIGFFYMFSDFSHNSQRFSWHLIVTSLFPASMDASHMQMWVLIQCLRDVSKRTDLQISESSLDRLIKGVSPETSLRSLRFSQRHLLVASETVILGLQTKSILATCSSRCESLNIFPN